ncbi:hypothetical protein [Streptomyces yunnanensis]|uniref:hypothetical protein n=1 Tax=Streptomyces yunnanensis TaxID=156453 RepID=UPI0011613E44|nr:hypothetical protein [Streptomyces yunnanensis]
MSNCVLPASDPVRLSLLRISAEEARLGEEYLESQHDRYPTVAANHYIADDDGDANFEVGLGSFSTALRRRRRAEIGRAR